MTFLIGSVLMTAILLWQIGSRYEWSIPSKWQAHIKSVEERLSGNTQSIALFWESVPNGELEKRFWLLHRALPRLQRNYQIPVCLKVRIKDSSGQTEKYIACLRRRFPKIIIDECPLHSRNSEGENEH